MSVASLVDTTWLTANLANPHVVVVDTRWYLLNPPQGHEEYLASHIAGAVYLSIDHDLSAEAWDGPGRHPLPKPERFVATMSQAGIDSSCHVIIYDSAGGSTATRLWWLLRYYGHTAVSILDGGWQAWVAGDGAVRSGNETRAARQFVGTPNHALTVDADQVELLRHDQQVLILDARAHERYTGAVEPFGPRAGHIPGAVSAPFAGNLNADGTLKPAAELATRYHDLGANQVQQVVCYCGSGVTATHDIFALHLAGIDATLYPGSWSDWSSQEARPIATGEHP
jgi:thiosulfate/3-mercaptopyruvate sulfurtransferase